MKMISFQARKICDVNIFRNGQPVPAEVYELDNTNSADAELMERTDWPNAKYWPRIKESFKEGRSTAGEESYSTRTIALRSKQEDKIVGAASVYAERPGHHRIPGKASPPDDMYLEYLETDPEARAQGVKEVGRATLYGVSQFAENKTYSVNRGYENGKPKVEERKFRGVSLYCDDPAAQGFYDAVGVPERRELAATRNDETNWRAVTEEDGSLQEFKQKTRRKLFGI